MTEPRRWFVVNSDQVVELDQQDRVLHRWPEPELFDRLVLAGYPLAELPHPVFGHRVFLDLVVDNADSSPLVVTVRTEGGAAQYPLDRKASALFEQWLAER